MIPAPPPDPEAQKKETAKQRFLKGLELSRTENLDAALVEFLAANEIHPTRAATLNAARTLLQLKRYVEALEMYQMLVQKFSADLQPSEKKALDDVLAKLQAYIGELVVSSNQPGTTVIVDGQERGSTPLSQPVRVNAGTHSLRAYKEGFVPFETQIMVAGGTKKAVQATLKPLTRSGRILVTEAGGGVFDVVVDGAVVGKTPWEGVLAVGTHTVLLRGEDQMGSPPTSAELKENATTSLTLRAQKLDAQIRVEPTPANARVAVDGVTIGNGVWQGQMTNDKHRIEVFAPGFLGFGRDVTILPGKTENLVAVLKRNPDDPMWGGFRPHIYAEAMAGLAVAPSFGGSADEACTGSCSSLPLGMIAGLRGGYALARGLGLELTVGFLTMRETMTRTQTATADPHVQSLVSTDWQDATRITGPLAAISASYQFLDKTPLTVRVLAGAARVKATFGNGGTFAGRSRDPNNASQTGSFRVPFDLKEEEPNLWVPLVGPEVRFGVRFSDSFLVDVGMAALFMFPAATDRKKFDGTVRSYAITGSPGTYPDGTPIPQPGEVELPPERGFGTIVALTPSIAARYDF